VLRVRHRITNHVLQKNLENPASLFVDQPTDSLHATSSRQPPNRGLRDALDVVAEHLTMPLSASLSQTLASLSTTRHCSIEVGIFCRSEKLGIWLDGNRGRGNVVFIWSGKSAGMNREVFSYIVTVRVLLINGLYLRSVARCSTHCGQLMLIIGRLDWLVERLYGSQAALPSF